MIKYTNTFFNISLLFIMKITLV